MVGQATHSLLHASARPAAPHALRAASSRDLGWRARHLATMAQGMGPRALRQQQVREWKEARSLHFGAIGGSLLPPCPVGGDTPSA
jgi:hypothetical protein